MFGDFTLQRGDAVVSDTANRSRKVWLILAYMTYFRSRPVSTEELMALLWGEEECSANPLNALKTILHRVRASLEPLGSQFGHGLLTRQGGMCVWNADIPVWVDVDEFSARCQSGAAASEPEEKLAQWMPALALYRGSFLSKLSSESWVAPLIAYHHNLYVQTVLEALPLLQKLERWQEAEALCRAAIQQEPYLEPLYQQLMTILIHLGDQRSAVCVYETMSDLLMSEFGIMPSTELRALYHEALRMVDARAMSLDMVVEQLREPGGKNGALICSFDFFRAIYHSVARLIERSGDAVHLGLVSVSGRGGTDLSRRSLNRVVGNLLELIPAHLRRGDIVARCSVSQFVLLLPQTNFENARMVCDRIVRAFYRQYPHSPAMLLFSVRAIEPSTLSAQAAFGSAF